MAEEKNGRKMAILSPHRPRRDEREGQATTQQANQPKPLLFGLVMRHGLPRLPLRRGQRRFDERLDLLTPKGTLPGFQKRSVTHHCAFLSSRMGTSLTLADQLGSRPVRKAAVFGGEVVQCQHHPFAIVDRQHLVPP